MKRRARPGLDPGPATTTVNFASGWSRYPPNNKHWWLWVPAFRGDDERCYFE
jgi:hypothetical protein